MVNVDYGVHCYQIEIVKNEDTFVVYLHRLTETKHIVQHLLKKEHREPIAWNRNSHGRFIIRNHHRNC